MFTLCPAIMALIAYKYTSTDMIPDPRPAPLVFQTKVQIIINYHFRYGSAYVTNNSMRANKRTQSVDSFRAQV